MSKRINLDQFLKSLYSEMPMSDAQLDAFMSKEPEHKMPDKMAQGLVENLKKVQRETVELNERLANPSRVNTLGEYLALLRKKRELDIPAVSAVTAVPCQTLEHIEKNTVSVTEIPLPQMKSIIQWMGTNLNDALELVRKSYALFKLSPSYEGASARYDLRESSVAERDASLNSAFQELLLKGSKYQNDEKIESYLSSLRGTFERQK